MIEGLCLSIKPPLFVASRVAAYVELDLNVIYEVLRV